MIFAAGTVIIFLMNEMLDAQDSLYEMSFVSVEEFYCTESFHVDRDALSSSVTSDIDERSCV